MRRTAAALVAGLIAGALFIGPALGGPPGRFVPDPSGCTALVELELQARDQAFAAHQGLYASPPRVLRAKLLLTKVDESWARFWVLAQRCSKNH